MRHPGGTHSAETVTPTGLLPHQMTERDAERIGNEVEVIKSCGLRPQLDTHDRHPRQIRVLSQPLLRPLPAFPGLPDPPADCPAPRQ